MPLHQISVIPRDVTSSRVSGSGKSKEKDKQVCEEGGKASPVLITEHYGYFVVVVCDLRCHLETLSSDS